MAPLYRLRRRLRHWAQEVWRDAESRLAARQFARRPCAQLVAEIDLEGFGADNLWIADVDGDGDPELLWLQTQGIFKSSLYRDQSRYRFLARGAGLSCLTVTDIRGRVKWQRGEPYREEEPYASHAGERMLAIGEAGDEALILLHEAPDRLVLLEGSSGHPRSERRLPGDHFAVAAVLARRRGDPGFAVSVMDSGHGSEPYATPTLFLDHRLQTTASRCSLGSGHRLLACDLGDDGIDQLLDGYELLDREGRRAWLLDAWRDREDAYDAQRQHLDHVSPIRIDGHWHAAIAGSDRLYWIDARGHVLWQVEPRHAQYAFAGHFDGSGRPPLVLLVDSLTDTWFRAYDLGGRMLWQRPAVQHWPVGCPRHLRRAWFHMGVPAAHWRAPADGRPDLMIFCEGGWPYALDGKGRVAAVFPWQKRAERQPRDLPRHRADDFGEAFQARCHDLDGDGEDEVILFDRRTAWIFKVPAEVGAP